MEDLRNDKYLVIDRQINQEVEGFFILQPEIDAAARTALATYGACTKDINTKEYINKRLIEIETSPLAGERKNKRYLVIDRKTNQEIEGFFILRPEIDAAARTALAAYGVCTIDLDIKEYINKRLLDIAQMPLSERR